MKLNKSHQLFVQHVANGASFKDAYISTYPNKNLTNGALRVEASKLAKLLAKDIEKQKGVALEIVRNSAAKSIEESIVLNVKTLTQRIQYLTDVMDGKIKVKKPFVIGGKIIEYPSEPTHKDRIEACIELNKLEGSYAAQKLDLGQPFVLKVGYGTEEDD